MRKFMNRLAIVSLVALPIAAATTIVPAGASVRSANFRVVGVHALVSPNIPNSNIVGQGKTAKFVPDHLKYKDQSTTDCTSPVSFTITNTGTKTANIYIDGAGPYFTIAAASELELCGSAAAGTTDTFGLGNAAGTKQYAATLAVTSN